MGGKQSSTLYNPVREVSENVANRHRAWMGVAFSLSYPIGMLYLALAANYLPEWRDLQLALTVPVVTLPFLW